MKRTALLFALLVLPACRGDTPKATPEKTAVAATATTARTGAYPYPECEQCVKHIKDSLGEPETLQIIEWDRHTIAELRKGEWPRRAAQDTLIFVRYRAKNDKGGWSVWHQNFSIGPPEGKILRASSKTSQG